MSMPMPTKRVRKHPDFQKASWLEKLVFLGPLLFFLILLYGTLLWTIYVSFTDWKTIAPNYIFKGLNWGWCRATHAQTQSPTPEQAAESVTACS